MKRVIIMVCFIAVFSMGISMYACAKAKSPIVNLTEKGELEYQNGTSMSNGNIELGEAFKGLAPGEIREEKITITNHNNHTAKFYMNMDVLKTLEDTVQASRGAYTVLLSLDETKLYDSMVGGALLDDSNNLQNGGNGLKEVTDGNLEDVVYLAALKKGESAHLSLTVGLEGESVRNGYQNAEGTIGFRFMAVYDEESPRVIEVIEKKTKAPENKVIKTISEIVVAVKTGDESPIEALAVIIAMGLLTLFLTSKKKKNAITVILLCIISGSFLSVTAEASPEKIYTVTYRAGKVGTFSKQYQSEIEKEMQEAGNAVTVSDKKIQVDMKAGEGKSYPRLPQGSNLVIEGEYYMLEDTLWPKSDETVTKSEEYVVQYGKLVNGAEYAIHYIDTDSGEQIALSEIAKGEIGSERTQHAKSIGGYTLQSKESITIQLTEKPENNRIIFEYRKEPNHNTEINVVTEYEEGNAITTYETLERVYYRQAADAGSNGRDGQGKKITETEEIIPENQKEEENREPEESNDKPDNKMKEEPVLKASEAEQEMEESGSKKAYGVIAGSVLGASAVAAGILIKKRRMK